MAYEEINASFPVARKEYHCEWCGQKILKGEKHFSRFYKFLGDTISGRMHGECKIAMDESAHDEICDGWSFGDMPRGRPIRPFV